MEYNFHLLNGLGIELEQQFIFISNALMVINVSTLNKVEEDFQILKNIHSTYYTLCNEIQDKLFEFDTMSFNDACKELASHFIRCFIVYNYIEELEKYYKLNLICKEIL